MNQSVCGFWSGRAFRLENFRASRDAFHFLLLAFFVSIAFTEFGEAAEMKNTFRRSKVTMSSGLKVDRPGASKGWDGVQATELLIDYDPSRSSGFVISKVYLEVREPDGSSKTLSLIDQSYELNPTYSNLDFSLTSPRQVRGIEIVGFSDDPNAFLQVRLRVPKSSGSAASVAGASSGGSGSPGNRIGVMATASSPPMPQFKPKTLKSSSLSGKSLLAGEEEYANYQKSLEDQVLMTTKQLAKLRTKDLTRPNAENSSEQFNTQDDLPFYSATVGGYNKPEVHRDYNRPVTTSKTVTTTTTRTELVPRTRTKKIIDPVTCKVRYVEETYYEEETITETTTETKTETKNQRKRPKKIRFNFSPMFFVDYFKSQKIIALDDQFSTNNIRQVRDSGKDPESLVNTVEFTYSNRPLWVEKKFRVGAGLGGAVMANVANSGLTSYFGLAAGLMPISGSNAIGSKVVNSLDEAESYVPRGFPKDMNEVLSFEVGEKLSWLTMQGFARFFNIASGPASIGPRWADTSEKAVTIERLDETRFYFNITKSEKMYKALGLNMFLFSKDYNPRLKGESITHSFVFDISNAEARVALAMILFEKDFRYAQNIINQSMGKTGVPGVEPVDTEITKILGVLGGTHSKFGLPWGYVAKGLGLRTKTFQNYYDHANGAQTKAWHGIAENTRDWRGPERHFFFGNETYNERSTMTTTLYNTDPTGPERPENIGYFAHFRHTYDDTTLREFYLNGAFKQLVRRTGFFRNHLTQNLAHPLGGGDSPFNLWLKIPKYKGDKDRVLGYGKLQYDIEFSQEALDALFEAAKDPRLEAWMLEKTEAITEHLFQSVPKNELIGSWGFCNKWYRFDAKICKDGGGNEFDTLGLIGEARKATPILIRALQWADAAKARGDYERFVEEMAEFGKQMMQTPAMFQVVTFLADEGTKGRGLKGELQVMGTHLKQFKVPTPFWNQHMVSGPNP